MMKKVFNWSEVHSERSNFLQNTYFKKSQNWLKWQHPWGCYWIADGCKEGVGGYKKFTKKL